MTGSKTITFPSRAGEPLTAEYEPHELEFMALLRSQLDGPDSGWAMESMQAIHEMKALFPGSRILETPAAEEDAPSEDRSTARWTEVAAETREAIERVDQHAEAGWKQAALEAVRKTCEELPEFISDDIWERGLDSTREDRALGPVLMRAKKNGWCVKTNMLRPSVRSHLSGKPVWKSLIYFEGTLL